VLGQGSEGLGLRAPAFRLGGSGTRFGSQRFGSLDSSTGEVDHGALSMCGGHISPQGSPGALHGDPYSTSVGVVRSRPCVFGRTAGNKSDDPGNRVRQLESLRTYVCEGTNIVRRGNASN